MGASCASTLSMHHPVCPSSISASAADNSTSKHVTPNMTRPIPASKNPSSHYPPHTYPRVWFITAAASPIGISLSRELLAHGDIIVAGDDGGEDVTRSSELASLLDDADGKGWGDRLRVVKLVSRCEALVLSFVVSTLWTFDFLFHHSWKEQGEGGS